MGVDIGEFEAKVAMQEILNKSMERLFMTKNLLSTVTALADELGSLILELVFKYGFDGSSGHPTRKKNPVGGQPTDESTIVASHLVILQLTRIDENGDKQIVWRNELYNSKFKICLPTPSIFLRKRINW